MLMVGLRLVRQHNTRVAVKLDLPGAKEHLSIDLNKLADSILRDPDLAAVHEHERLLSVQACYVVPWCEYTSFIAGVGKASLFKAFASLCVICQ